MPVKPSRPSMLNCFSTRALAAALLLAAVSGCSAMGLPSPVAVWRDFKGEREPQVVSGPRRLPMNHQVGMQGDELARSAYSEGANQGDDEFSVPVSAPNIRYQPYVPVEPAEPALQRSQPVELKRDAASEEDEYDGNHVPMPPMPEPTFFDKMGGWFSSGVYPDASEHSRYSVVMVPVSQVVATDVEEGIDAPKYLPLSVVPATPMRLQEIRAERAEMEHMLRAEQAKSLHTRAEVEVQRADEASESLLTNRQ